MTKEKVSRQVRRQNDRLRIKSKDTLSTHELYYIGVPTTSRAGVEYINYKKVIDLKGLRK